MEDLDYIRLIAIANEIVERGTTSDFLNYKLADFEVSILGSGRLGVEQGRARHSGHERVRQPCGHAIDSRGTRGRIGGDSAEASTWPHSSPRAMKRCERSSDSL